MTMDEHLREFLEDVKSLSYPELIEKWGGCRFDIPAFRGALREQAVRERYAELDASYTREQKVRVLVRRFGMSASTIRRMIAGAD